MPSPAPTVQRLIGAAVLFSTLSFLLSSCANHHFRVPAAGSLTTAPGYVELLADKQVANLHFPAGIYSFYRLDNSGWYYRAPRPILQHTGGGSVARNGGIHVSKRNRHKLRGYVFYAGALTHVGDLSGTPHVFH
jgi:hypothetical protein